MNLARWLLLMKFNVVWAAQAALFAFQQSGIQPDIVALAKGLGGGFPVGAIIARKQIGDAMGPGSHGTTFGGNPLAMAAGNAVMDVLEQDGFL